MKTLTYISKKKGFLFITVTIIITILLFNLLIGYRIIFRKGERIESFYKKIEIDEKVDKLETLAYSELRRVDISINNGEYGTGAEYIGIGKSLERVWFGDTKDRESKTGYQIVSMRINDKNRFYIYKEGEFANFKQLIMRELYSTGNQSNKIGVELKKVILNNENKEKIYFKARVDLYYNYGNKNPAAPNKEVLKDFEVGFE